MIKQRVARAGEGRSGGFRTIILFHSGERAIFAYGFAKNERDNITVSELAEFRALAKVLLGVDDSRLAKAVENGTLVEVSADG